MAGGLPIAPLVNGDIIHVANKELRFGYEPSETPRDFEPSSTEPGTSQAPASVIHKTAFLREMIRAAKTSTSSSSPLWISSRITSSAMKPWDGAPIPG